MQASSHVIPLWLITLASKELSRFEVTSSDLSAESGSMEGGGGVVVPFLPNGRKENENNKGIGIKDSLF